MLKYNFLPLWFRGVFTHASFFVVLSITTTVHSQNLVPNPSIEIANCPTSYSGFPIGVESMIPDWYSVTCTSPDAFTSCSNNAWTQVPNNLFGSQSANTGTNYLGFGMYSGWYDYVGCKLTCSLIGGYDYEISFWVSRCDNARYAADEIGMYLSSAATKMTCGFGNTVLPYSPQIKNTPGNYLADQTGWTKISGTYTAMGGEQYITIGYFKAWNTADFLDGGTGYSLPRSVYYVDDISIVGTGDCPLFLEMNLNNNEPDPVVFEKIKYVYNAQNRTLSILNSKEVKDVFIQSVNGTNIELNKITEQEYRVPLLINGFYILNIKTDKEMIRDKIILME